jgi:hypothetical protein
MAWKTVGQADALSRSGGRPPDHSLKPIYLYHLTAHSSVPMSNSSMPSPSPSSGRASPSVSTFSPASTLASPGTPRRIPGCMERYLGSAARLVRQIPVPLAYLLVLSLIILGAFPIGVPVQPGDSPTPFIDHPWHVAETRTANGQNLRILVHPRARGKRISKVCLELYRHQGSRPHYCCHQPNSLAQKPGVDKELSK